MSDADHAIAKAYGAWVLKEKPGREPSWGIQRSTFVIGKDGIIKAAWPNVRVEGHAAEVLAAV